MKYLFIFLTLPFLICADQEEINNFIDYQNYHFVKSKYDDFFNPNFYKNRLEVYSDGHVWIPVMFHHSDNCPCNNY